MEHIGRRIKVLRDYFGLSQKEFAEKIGVTRGALSMIEIGKNTPTPKINAKIKEVFDVSHIWLIAGEGATFNDGNGIAYPITADPKTAIPANLSSNDDFILLRELVRSKDKHLTEIEKELLLAEDFANSLTDQIETLSELNESIKRESESLKRENETLREMIGMLKHQLHGSDQPRKSI